MKNIFLSGMLKNQSIHARNTFHIILKVKSKSDSRSDVISNFFV